MGPPVPSLEYMSRLKGSGGSSPLQYINSYQLLGGRPLQRCRHPYLAHASVTPVKLIGSPSWMELILCSVMSHLSEVGRHLFSSPQKRSLKSPARKPYFPPTGGAIFLGQPFSKKQRSSLPSVEQSAQLFSLHPKLMLCRQTSHLLLLSHFLAFFHLL